MTAGGGSGGDDDGPRFTPHGRRIFLAQMYNELYERSVCGWRSFTFEAVCVVNRSQLPRYVDSLLSELSEPDASPRWQA